LAEWKESSTFAPRYESSERAALKKRKNDARFKALKEVQAFYINKKSTTYHASGIKYKKKYVIHNTKYGVRKPSLKYGKTAVSIEVNSDTEGKQA